MSVSLRRNILTTFSSRVIVLGLALVSSMVLARALGPEMRGLFALVMLLPEMARNFGLLGIEEATAVYAGLAPEGRRALVWHSARTAAVVGGFLALCGVAYFLLGAPGFPGLAAVPPWLGAIPFLLIPARLLIEYWLAILRGMNRILALNLVEVGTKALSLSFVVVLVALLKGGVPAAVGGDAVVVVVTVLILARLLQRGNALGRPIFDPPLWKRTRRFALTAYVGSVLTFLNYRIDQVILVFLLPIEQLAFYALAVEIAERLWIIPGSIGMALLPHLTNSPQRDPALAAVIARHAALWTGAACLVLDLLAGFAVDLIYSSAYHATVAPLRWLLPGIFTLTISKVVVAELAAREKIGFTLWLMPLVVGLNTGLNFLLIPHMGIAGAAFASTISYTFMALAITTMYLLETGVSWSLLIPRWSDLALYRRLLRRRGKDPTEAASAEPSTTPVPAEAESST